MKFDHRQIEVFVGVDMAKQDHYAQAVAATGSELFHRSVLNDEAAIEKLIFDPGRHGQVALVIDMPSSDAQSSTAMHNVDGWSMT
jgi:Transposase